MVGVALISRQKGKTTAPGDKETGIKNWRLRRLQSGLLALSGIRCDVSSLDHASKNVVVALPWRVSTAAGLEEFVLVTI